jgi:hypothetical protein
MIITAQYYYTCMRSPSAQMNNTVVARFQRFNLASVNFCCILSGQASFCWKKVFRTNVPRSTEILKRAKTVFQRVLHLAWRERELIGFRLMVSYLWWWSKERFLKSRRRRRRTYRAKNYRNYYARKATQRQTTTQHKPHDCD